MAVQKFKSMRQSSYVFIYLFLCDLKRAGAIMDFDVKVS